MRRTLFPRGAGFFFALIQTTEVRYDTRTDWSVHAFSVYFANL